MNEQNIFKNDNVTSNSAQLETLKKNFPNCFDKDGHFILDSFKEVIKENDLDFSEESYSLNWLGKSYAQLLRNEKAHTFIQPNHDHNNQEINQNSQNLLIKGDNLEVLKHLRNAYSEKIKMIYIDPPYNTGSDGFIYQDDRKFSKEELMHLAKVSEDEAKRILDFTAKGSNSHSAWLTFIYPRLYVARELLREDGVIFISIDDNEQAQLKLLCDEIFGEENLITNFIVSRSEGGGLAKHAITGHDYLLVYAKNENTFSPLLRPKDIRGKIVVIDNEEYWIEEDWLRKEFGKYGTCPYNEIIHYHGEAKKKEIDRGIAEGKYVLINKKDQTIVGRYRKVSEDGSKFYTILKHLTSTSIQDLMTIGLQDIFKYPTPNSLLENTTQGATLIKHLNKNGVKDLELLEMDKFFSFPKPVSLIFEMIRGTTFHTQQKQDIVLDFFAGSGTTAHAVMDLNAEDNGNRQFILVQLPEETDKKSEAYKAGYKNIFEITKARIEKAGEKIKQNHPEYEGDLGFKVFETAPLPDHYNNEVLELSAESQTEMFDGAKNDEQLLNAILTTWTLYDRIPLTSSLESLLIDDYNAQYSSEYNTLYLMQPNFTTQNTKTLINKIETDPQFVPEKIVIYGFNFDSKIQRELDEALKSYQNKKSLNIDLLVRYY